MVEAGGIGDRKMRGRSGFTSKRWGQRLLVTTFSGYLSAIIAPAAAAGLHPRERSSSSVLALVIQRPPQLSTPSVGPGASYSLRSTDPSASCTHRHPRDASVGFFAGHADSTFPTDTPRFFPFRFPACREFFQALEACHANFWTKWTGGCNTAKNQLNSCLHKEVSGALPPLYFRATCRFANDGLETMVRASKNREDAKVRQAKKEQAWKELHEDD